MSTVDFKSPYTLAAMREMYPLPDRWYTARRYHHSVLAPAIEAGLMIAETDPSSGRTGRRYRLTDAGVAFLNARSAP